MSKQVKKQEHQVQLIDRANDISAFCSRDEARRVITGVYMNGNGTEATDGRVLIRVPYKQIPVEEFPKVKLATNERTPVILPPKVLQDALKSAPNHAALPVIECVRVSTVKDGNILKAQLTTTDLDTNRVIEARVIEGEYPPVDAVMPGGEPALKISIGAEILKRIADYSIKHSPDRGVPSIEFGFYSPTEAARFTVNLEDGRKAEGALMPMRAC